jgi:hypothetical protein
MKHNNNPHFSRRQFLKVAGIAGASLIPAYLGYQVLQVGKGVPPAISSPFDDISFTSHATGMGEKPYPILVLNNSSPQNFLNNYLAEILLAEGLNCFQIASISELSNIDLKRYSLALLSEGTINTSQAEQFSEYVAQGGHLIAMRPAEQLEPIFSVQRLPGGTAEAYIQINSDHPFVEGIESVSLQYHGVANHYALEGSQSLAWISDNTGNKSIYPALVFNEYGQGSVVLWAYDLSKSIIYTRQGNPEWTNMERDGREGIRAHDAFVGWIDLDRIEIPQADVQMRLLTRLVTEMLMRSVPLPRIWYFPGAAKGILVATGDAHVSPVESINEVVHRFEARDGYMSIYYTPPQMNRYKRLIQRSRSWLSEVVPGNIPFLKGMNIPTPKDVREWRARGHEFSIHPYVDEGLEAGWEACWDSFTGMGYGTDVSTVRTHKILWTGWVESARVQASYGIGMNLDYYHYGPAFQKSNGEWVYGYFTGSGLPMRFVDQDGRLLAIYQQLTNLVDEHVFKMPWGMGGSNLDVLGALNVSRNLMQKSLNGAYCAITGQFHIDPFTFGGEIGDTAGRWLDGTLDFAASNNIPIWSAAKWLEFNEYRRNATINNLEWYPSTNTLRFNISSDMMGGVNPFILIPEDHITQHIVEVTIDGKMTSLVERKVGGMNYCGVNVNSGDHIIEARYQ